MSEAPRRPLLVQAPVKALDADGSIVAAIGTLAFALASVVLGWQLPQLDAAGHRWWWWVALAGTGIGAAGFVAARVRRGRRRSGPVR